jgi:heme exporter protein B
MNASPTITAGGTLGDVSLVRMLGWLVWRDLTLAWRRRSDVVGSLLFFVMVVALFPLSIGPETRFLQTIAPGVLWIAALLASTLSLSRLFAEDCADGTLEQMMLTPQPPCLMVLGKVLAHWVVYALPLLVTAPLMTMQFGLSLPGSLTLIASLAAGTPVVLLIGSIGAALTLGLRGAGALTPLLVMPLFVPPLVFGAGAVQAAVDGMSTDANMRLLAATSIVTFIVAPWATAAALRISLE